MFDFYLTNRSQHFTSIELIFQQFIDRPIRIITLTLLIIVSPACTSLLNISKRIIHAPTKPKNFQITLVTRRTIAIQLCATFFFLLGSAYAPPLIISNLIFTLNQNSPPPNHNFIYSKQTLRFCVVVSLISRKI